MSSGPLQLTPLQDFPLVFAGDDLAEMIVHAMQRQDLTPDASGVLVVAQKIISKSEGRLVNLADVRVTEEAASLAADAQKDPRLITLILQESRAVIRIRPGLVIAEHRTGHILANAGIDASNVGVSGEYVLLWPEDPDESARQLSARIARLTGVHIPIVINDSLGRPWRMGTVGFAIGTCGLEPVWDQVGEQDLDGRKMQVTAPAMADALAAAASLVQGETNQGQPVVWATGCPMRLSESATSHALLRIRGQDLFR